MFTAKKLAADFKALTDAELASPGELENPERTMMMLAAQTLLEGEAFKLDQIRTLRARVAEAHRILLAIDTHIRLTDLMNASTDAQWDIVEAMDNWFHNGPPIETSASAGGVR